MPLLSIQMPSLFLVSLCLLPLAFSFDRRLNDLPVQSCLNGGDLVDGECECTLNYEGRRCEEEICKNGGRAKKDKDGQTICLCPFRTFGERCHKTDFCVPDQGELTPEGTCSCSPGFAGIHCQDRPCHHGVPRVDEEGALLCSCDRGFVGFFCGEELVCQHRGSVNALNECECVNGWRGERCERCDYHVENERCIQQVTGESLVATSPILEWPILAAIGAAVILMVLLFVAVGFAVRSWRTKSSRVSSAQGSAIVPPEGTDV